MASHGLAPLSDAAWDPEADDRLICLAVFPETHDTKAVQTAEQDIAAMPPAFTVTFKSDRTAEVRADQSILLAARERGMMLPASCRTGLCGTCKSKLLSGAVDMQHQGGIRQREINAGLFLPCCSKPLSDLVVDR